MVTSPVRPLLLPGVAAAAAGALALAPALTAPAAVPAAPRVSVHVEDVALAGIGQDIYYAITPWVQYAVGGGSYLINFIPLVGGLAAAQINITYFQGIQPVVEATVDYLAALVQDPLGVLPITVVYGGALADIGYNFVSAQLQFFGFPPLAPLPQGAAATTANPAPADRASSAGLGDARPPRSDSPTTSSDSADPASSAGRGDARPPRSDSPTTSSDSVTGATLSDSPMAGATSGDDVVAPAGRPSAAESDAPAAAGDKPAAGAPVSLSVGRESLRGGHSTLRVPHAERPAAEGRAAATATRG